MLVFSDHPVQPVAAWDDQFQHYHILLTTAAFCRHMHLHIKSTILNGVSSLANCKGTRHVDRLRFHLHRCRHNSPSFPPLLPRAALPFHQSPCISLTSEFHIFILFQNRTKPTSDTAEQNRSRVYSLIHPRHHAPIPEILRRIIIPLDRVHREKDPQRDQREPNRRRDEEDSQERHSRRHRSRSRCE